jgi:L-threonylcarbamoyladenylate synthase
VPLVGIRLPSNEIAQKMLTTVELPIAAPSANLSGKASPTTAQMVYDNFGEKIPLIIDGGKSEAGIESTVLRVIPLTKEGQKGSKYSILILRPGFITKEDIEICFNHQIPVAYTTNNPELSP